MRSPVWHQRLMVVALSVMTLGLALPHRHHASTVSHDPQSCRACKIQERCAAIPCGAMAATGFLQVCSELVPHPSASPRKFLVVRHALPRAPPSSS